MNAGNPDKVTSLVVLLVDDVHHDNLDNTCSGGRSVEKAYHYGYLLIYGFLLLLCYSYTLYLLLILGQNDAIKIIYVSDAEFETGNLSSSDTENLFLE